MAISWNQLPLTAAQQAIMQSLVTLGTNLPGQVTVPTLTHSQAKAASAFLQELDTLLAPARRGARYTMDFYRAQALNAFENNNP